MIDTGGDPGHAPARRVYEKADYTLLPSREVLQGVVARATRVLLTRTRLDNRSRSGPPRGRLWPPRSKSWCAGFPAGARYLEVPRSHLDKRASALSRVRPAAPPDRQGRKQPSIGTGAVVPAASRSVSSGAMSKVASASGILPRVPLGHWHGPETDGRDHESLSTDSV